MADLLLLGLIAIVVLVVVMKVLKFAVTKILFPIAIVYLIFYAWKSGYIPGLRGG